MHGLNNNAVYYTNEIKICVAESGTNSPPSAVLQDPRAAPEQHSEPREVGGAAKRQLRLVALWGVSWALEAEGVSDAQASPRPQLKHRLRSWKAAVPGTNGDPGADGKAAEHNEGRLPCPCRNPGSCNAFMDIYFTGDLRNIKLDQSAVSKEINDSRLVWGTVRQ